jgi:hypothetical protein
LAALRRPIQETAERADRLRRALEALGHSLNDLRFLFDAAEAEIGKVFEQRRLFLHEREPSIEKALYEWLADATAPPTNLRSEAFEQAARLVEREIDDWRQRVEPEMRALYGHLTRRFVTLANDHLARIGADPGALTVEKIDAEDVPPYERPRFYFTSLMHRTAGSPVTWLVDRVAPRRVQVRSVADGAVAYLHTLADRNSHRVENDFRERTADSRRALERQLRATLADAVQTAERALRVATESRTLGEERIRERVETLSTQRQIVRRLASPQVP